MRRAGPAKRTSVVRRPPHFDSCAGERSSGMSWEPAFSGKVPTPIARHAPADRPIRHATAFGEYEGAAGRIFGNPAK